MNVTEKQMNNVNINKVFLMVLSFFCAVSMLLLMSLSEITSDFKVLAADVSADNPSDKIFLSEDGHFYSLDFENGTAELILAKRKAETVAIPETLVTGRGAYTVTRVLQGAFAENVFLREVILPDTVTYIGSHAFFGCVSLTKVEARGLASVGTEVFSGTPFITSGEFVTLGRVLLRYNGEGAVVDNLPSVTFIADAFAWNSFITKVVVPAGVKTLGDGAFACAEALESVVLPVSLDKIGDKVFFACVSLEDVNVGTAVNQIGESAFSGTPYLSGLLEAGEGMAVTNGGVLLKYSGTESSVSVPAEVSALSDAFAYSAVSVVELPDRCRIGGGAFRGASKLTRVTVKGDCGGISDFAFEGCEKMRLLIFEGNFTGTLERSAFKGVSDKLSVYHRNGMTGFDVFAETAFPAVSPWKIK